MTDNDFPCCAPEKGHTMNDTTNDTTNDQNPAELSPLDGPRGVGDLLRSDPGRVARYAEASTLTIEVIAAMWRGHAACTWVSTGHDVVWSCGIIHPRPIHMQPTTRDRHFAALLKTQIDADIAVADEERAALVAEVERLNATLDRASRDSIAEARAYVALHEKARAAEAKVAKVEAERRYFASGPTWLSATQAAAVELRFRAVLADAPAEQRAEGGACPGCGSRSCKWKRLECESPVTDGSKP